MRVTGGSGGGGSGGGKGEGSVLMRVEKYDKIVRFGAGEDSLVMLLERKDSGGEKSSPFRSGIVFPASSEKPLETRAFSREVRKNVGVVTEAVEDAFEMAWEAICGVWPPRERKFPKVLRRRPVRLSSSWRRIKVENSTAAYYIYVSNE